MATKTYFYQEKIDWINIITALLCIAFPFANFLFIITHSTGDNSLAVILALINICAAFAIELIIIASYESIRFTKKVKVQIHQEGKQ